MENQQQETVVESTPVVETVAEAPAAAPVAERVPQKSAAVVVFLIISAVFFLICACFNGELESDFMFLDDTSISIPVFFVKLVGFILIMIGMGKKQKLITVIGAGIVAVTFLIEVVCTLNYAYALGSEMVNYLAAAFAALALCVQAVCLALVALKPEKKVFRILALIAFILALVLAAVRPFPLYTEEEDYILTGMLMVFPQIFTAIALKKAAKLR